MQQSSRLHRLLENQFGDPHDAGLVTRRKEGRRQYYRATARAEGLLTALDDTRGEVA